MGTTGATAVSRGEGGASDGRAAGREGTGVGGGVTTGDGKVTGVAALARGELRAAAVGRISGAREVGVATGASVASV